MPKEMSRYTGCTNFILSCLIAGGAQLFLGQDSAAQSELRPSVSATRNRRTIPEPVNYNLKLREITFKASAGLRAEFDDNITLSDDDRESDVIVTPSLSIDMFWPITPFNSLSLTTSIGYRKYLSHSELDSQSLAISPDSELNFDIFVGNFIINLHDRFAVLQDPIGEPTLSNVAEFGRFINTAGVTVFWNASSVLTLSGSYDHTDYITTNAEFDFADYAQDQVSLSSRYLFQDNLWGGVEAGAASTRYRTGEKADAVSSHVGLYAETILTPYTRLRVAGGVQSYEFSGGSNERIELLPERLAQFEDVSREDEFDEIEGDDEVSYYWNLELTNRLGRYFSHSLSAGRESQLAITAQRAEFFYVRYNADWRANSLISLGGNVFFEDGEEFGAGFPEEFRRIGAGVATGFQVSRKLSVSLGYQFYHKDSNLDRQSYYSNRFFVQLGYDF